MEHFGIKGLETQELYYQKLPKKV